MAHYGIEIYNNNTIIPSIYPNPEVRYTNYLLTPQAYNTNVVDRSHVAMPSSSSHVNVHNSYSTTDMSRWSNHNAYIFEHVSNKQNEYVPPYSSTEPASYCAPQTYMPMSNYYSRADMRAPADFGRSLYTAPDSIRMEMHRICFHHHLLHLARFIWLHLFIAELKKVQQTHLPLVPTGPTSTRAPTLS
jgi:hypothetical protein